MLLTDSASGRLAHAAVALAAFLSCRGTIYAIEVATERKPRPPARGFSAEPFGRYNNSEGTAAR